MVQALSCCVKTEETRRIRDREVADDLARNTSGGRYALDGPRDPRRLVPLSPMGNWSEIRRVGFDQQAVVRHESQQRVVRPLLECDDTAERNVPSRFEGRAGERVRARKAV